MPRTPITATLWKKTLPNKIGICPPFRDRACRLCFFKQDDRLIFDTTPQSCLPATRGPLALAGVDRREHGDEDRRAQKDYGGDHRVSQQTTSPSEGREDGE